MIRTYWRYLVLISIVVGMLGWSIISSGYQELNTNVPPQVRGISPILEDRPLLKPVSSDDQNADKSDTNFTTIFYSGNDAIIGDNLESAARYFETARSADPLQAPYLSATINLAWVYLQLGQSEQSFERMNEAITIYETSDDPTHFSILFEKRAQLYALSFDYDAAIADMDTVIDLIPDEAEHYNLRGQFIMLLYEWDRALEDYNTALALDPDYADAYFNRGVLFYTKAARENAQTDFARYLEIAPDGIHAEEAQAYLESIEIELETLGN